MLKAIPATDDCRVLEFKPPINRRMLIGHVIKGLLVNSVGGCEANCFMNDDCVSMNLGPLEDGKRVCELSNSDHDMHPEDLKYQLEFIYIPVWVSLSTLFFKTLKRANRQNEENGSWWI